ncbi:16S rRNA (guanine(527)-N(7))-methyltransferase RsmG [Candidatus Karelsulcia muelleri]|uniref:Ribosomal RNA small subunit methyltransferase G n=1 Tax=Candidatus Karelsulcia muelleri PSPU TaxID=1189303 RepID=A0AAD1EY35_9FLAO|nr:RsmG family class I SAM-dependent methyltransferase [Candidatus Karelsulcia muelleri]NJJ98719.1 16S rRNA (guanine(527)-N(7))-methyltransferase RsmG [Candidatus Karelsulcia muelleri]BAO66372.1 glucose-inhibited division protein B [Candidatus Karelsulcia muelleri PSPU]
MKKKIKNLKKDFSLLDEFKFYNFFKLYKLHKFFNLKINIISKNSLKFFYESHFLHSLSIYKIFYFFNKSIILDVGTGGGFPGIPLAIMFNKTKFILIDSIKKKIKLINFIINKLHLKNVYIQCTRIENFNKKCNFIIGRAVTKFTNFIKLVKKNILKNNKNKIDNGIIYLKGGNFKKNIFYIKYNISNLFKEKFFFNKYIIFIPIFFTKK